MQQTLTMFLFALIVGVIAASGCIFQIITAIAVTAVIITQWRPQDINCLAKSKADAEALNMKEELRSRAAQIALLKSDNATQLKLFKTIMSDTNKIRRTMTRHYIEFTLKLIEVDDELAAVNGVLTGKGDAAEGRGAVNGGHDLISWTPSTAAPPTSTAMAVAADAIPGLISWVSSAATASPSATPSPSMEQTNPRSQIPIPDPSLQLNFASPCSFKANYRSAKSSLRSLKSSPCSGKSTAIRRPANAFAFKSKLPVLDRTQAVKPTPATPVTVTKAAGAMDLISPASAANVASSLVMLPSPRLFSEHTTATSSVDVNQAVEGLISHNSAAHTPSPVIPLPAPVPTLSPNSARHSSAWCGLIASTVALPPPDKDEEDFFANRPRCSLKSSAPEQPRLKAKESKLERQQAKMAQSAKDRKELLKYMEFTRNRLNGADDPAKTARKFQRVLSTKGLSIESLEADYEALQLTGYVHDFKIPDLLPHVKEAINDNQFLER
ncbi:hypothetical protein BJ741DRAFT_671614 [Chytriomyces cf. hyalinus JEL632]|nr:hypothetical protein BJ741DRAFT_671614 [Chytriomyces cf. hyalinus JEL632]